MMANTPPKSGQPWTFEDTQTLRYLANENTPTRVMHMPVAPLVPSAIPDQVRLVRGVASASRAASPSERTFE
ncbi:hypothetical protein MEX01_40440 [Methylorubrum extorquens]|nr:hypothetical protein MEX01_40440 [Methylorubrum extorquens]